MRIESDPVMSSAWVLVYLLPIFAAILWFLSFIFIMVSVVPARFPPGPPTAQPMPLIMSMGFLWLASIIGFIASIILVYKLVKRRNTHFRRQIFLFEDVIAAVRAIAAKKGVDVEVGLTSCERTVREIKAEETEKGAVLWAILSAFIFIADWYVRYFLMRDFYKHERREDGFWSDMSRVLDRCGVKFSVPRREEALPKRSFVLYLILTIITLGLFGIYWIYVLLKDPNQHFKYHLRIEDQLLSTLESATV